MCPSCPSPCLSQQYLLHLSPFLCHLFYSSHLALLSAVPLQHLLKAYAIHLSFSYSLAIKGTNLPSLLPGFRPTQLSTHLFPKGPLFKRFRSSDKRSRLSMGFFPPPCLLWGLFPLLLFLLRTIWPFSFSFLLSTRADRCRLS